MTEVREIPDFNPLWDCARYPNQRRSYVAIDFRMGRSCDSIEPPIIHILVALLGIAHKMCMLRPRFVTKCSDDSRRCIFVQLRQGSWLKLPSSRKSVGKYFLFVSITFQLVSRSGWCPSYDRRRSEIRDRFSEASKIVVKGDSRTRHCHQASTSFWLFCLPLSERLPYHAAVTHFHRSLPFCKFR